MKELWTPTARAGAMFAQPLVWVALHVAPLMTETELEKLF
jgi:hypothetical protein